MATTEIHICTYMYMYICLYSELYHEAIQYMSMGGATCPRLHLQALINGGYVSKAFKVLVSYNVVNYN